MIIESGPRNSLLWRLSFAVSLSLHAAIAAFLFSSRLERPGAITVESMAVSINLERTAVTEAAEESAQREAASAFSPGGAAQPKHEIKPEGEAEPPEPEKEDMAREAEASAAREEAEREAGREEAERKEAELKAAERRETEHSKQEALRAAARNAKARRTEMRKLEQRRKERAEAARKEARRKAQAASRSGANGAAGARNARASKAQISASPGAIRNYGAIVRARIAAHKPAGRSPGHSVLIALAIEPSGRLSSASVARSSGESALDRAALAAIRDCSPFPPPPPGSRPRFTILFEFR